MKNWKPLLLVLIGTTFVFQTVAQDKSRIQPGRLYKSGETLYAPRLGFTAKVPDGWQGELPRETEVFSMSSTTPIYGEMLVFGREGGNLEAMRDAWLKGVDLSDDIKLQAVNPTIKDGILSSEVKAVGKYVNKGYRGFCMARCSPNGPCVTALALIPVQFYDSVKNTTIRFMERSTFGVPNNASIHSQLNWKEFLSNKSFFGYAYVEAGSKENKIELCADGTFTSTTKKKGLFKNDNPQYTGSNSGQWTADGIGEQTTLHLTFKKKGVPPLDIPLLIKDEQVFANGERYFVAESTKCK